MIGSLANEWILGVKMKDERLKVEKRLSLAKVMDRLERSVSIENIVNGFYINGCAFPEDDGEMLGSNWAIHSRRILYSVAI
ncbi:hypothetical protein V4S28_00360 [Enterococcus cecorum]